MKYIITITNVVFAILFLVILNQRIDAASNDLTFDQKFFAKDIAYTIDAMYSVNGEVEASYSIDEALNLEIKNGFVTVSYKLAKEKYPYIQDSKYNIDVEREGNSVIIKKIEVKE